MFYGKMLAVCSRYISDQDTAQEVLQEGFIKVFDKLEVFDFKGSFEGWVRRIVVNTAIDFIRKAKRAPILKDNDNDFKVEASNEIDFFNEIQSKVRKFVAGNEFEGTMLKPKFGDASGVRGAARLGRTMSY